METRASQFSQQPGLVTSLRPEPGVLVSRPSSDADLLLAWGCFPSPSWPDSPVVKKGSGTWSPAGPFPLLHISDMRRVWLEEGEAGSSFGKPCGTAQGPLGREAVIRMSPQPGPGLLSQGKE